MSQGGYGGGWGPPPGGGGGWGPPGGGAPPGGGGFGQPPGGGYGQPPAGGGFGQPPGGGYGQPPGGGYGQPPGGGYAPPPGGAPPGGGWGPPPGPPQGGPPPGAPAPGWGPQPQPGGFAPPPQGYPPGYTPSGGTAGAWSPQDAISFAWNRIKADPGTIIGALFVGGLCSSALSIVGGFIAQAYAAASILASAPVTHGHRYTASPDPFAIWFDPIYLSIRGGSSLLGYIVQAFMMAGMMNFALKVARGQQYSFGDIFSGGKWFLPVLAANFCIGFGVAFGLVLLIVPGIFLALAWSLTVPFAVDKDLGPFEAMAQSWKATEGQKGQIFVLGLFIFGMVVLGLCACGIGAIVAGAIAQVAWAWSYLRITGQQTAA